MRNRIKKLEWTCAGTRAYRPDGHLSYTIHQNVAYFWFTLDGESYEYRPAKATYATANKARAAAQRHFENDVALCFECVPSVAPPLKWEPTAEGLIAHLPFGGRLEIKRSAEKFMLQPHSVEMSWHKTLEDAQEHAQHLYDNEIFGERE